MKKKTKTVLLILIAAVVVAALIIGAVLLSLKGKPEEPENGEGEQSAEFPINLGNGVTVTGITTYAGMFVEDGSDAIVSGIPVVTLENKGDTAVQYLSFTLTMSDGEKYSFDLTTLLPGEKCTVLEKTQAAYNPEAEVAAAEVNGFAAFGEEPSLHEDVFEITYSGNTISVKNISGAKVSAGRVFYKNRMGDLLIGGITYMASFSELDAGESISIVANHFSEGNSRIVFVTYAE